MNIPRNSIGKETDNLNKKTKTLLSVLLAGTLLLGAVSAAAADSTTGSDAKQAVKALWNKFPGHGPDLTEMKAQATTQLKSLVDKGTITQAQADKVAAYLEKQAETRQAEAKKIKNMTDDERKAYLDQNKDNNKDALAQLVTDKVLSQDQADVIAQILPLHQGPGMHGKRMGQPGDPAKMKEVLNGLVSKGTLTQAQMDSILSSIEKLRSEHQAAMEKVKDMTDAERQSYMEQIRNDKTDIITQLVTDKVITSEQAEAIKDAMPQHPPQIGRDR
jgi:polyhydroxyalkanoate synthesis regulator phasin